VVPELDESGSVHHILSIVTDITAQREAEEARKRLNQQMQHAQKLESLGVLAGGIAHDFNNLLVAILGNAGLALMELTPESPARQTIQDIELAAQRAAELTRQMLAYSGKGRFVIEPLNLSRVVEEMAHLLEVSVSKRATVRYRFGEDLPTVEGDATQIRQVIMNLIMNASDALGEQSGVISISTGSTYVDRAYLSSAIVDGDLPEGEYVYLEVADTGIGMDEETRARMFDPFFTTKFVGRGLGLAAVMGIVRGHRGAITLDSEPEKGPTVRVLFPASESRDRVETGEADTPDEAASGGRTILVVDDDATVRSVTRRILEHAGFRVLLAEDGREGLQVYAENPGIALVLLDMTMPLMDGAEAFQELRRMNPEVSVVLTSGYNEQDATESFAGKGLAGFIQKPYRPQELLTRVYEVIGEDGG
jgi:signal transduction histidine kinase